MDTPSGDSHTNTAGTMIMLTPTDKFTTGQVFKTPDIGPFHIVDLIIITIKYPVEDLYINDKKLDVSSKPIKYISIVYLCIIVVLVASW